jgi:hypothetical protein
MKFFLSAICVALFSAAVLLPALTTAQVPTERSLRIKKAIGKIVLDGNLDEEDWKAAQVAGGFWQQFPYDTSAALQQSEARMTFDDEFLYISFVVYQPRKYAVQSLRRDFPQGGGTDLIFVNLDTFRDKQNAFHFAVNPYGVQREGLVANGDNVTNDWDNKWYTEVTNLDDRWVVEHAIPFKSLRYKVNEGTNTWNINFYRNNLSINERSSWTFMPRGFRGNNIAFTSPLIWETPPPQPAGNISLIPYTSLNANKDYLNQKPGNTRPGVGLDAKIAITTGLNLDLTVNPDFAQAEVDRQVTNLSRFELFFPERRQFFLENSDLFAGFGVGGVASSSMGGGGGGGGNNVITPFFSRRIGIARDTISGNNVIIPILGGARLSGKVSNRLRVGLLSMQTARQEGVQASANYSVLAVQQRVFSRSTIGLIMASKQDFDTNSEQPLFSNGFNRVIGLDYNLASRDGRLSGKIFAHKSFTPANPDDATSMAALFEYNSPRLSFNAGASRVGAGFNVSQIGFVPRNDVWRSSPQVDYSFFPKNPKVSSLVNSWGLGFDSDFRVQASTGKFTDWDFSPVQFFVRFVDNSVFRITPVRTDYTYLFDRSFDPSNRGKKPLPRGTAYSYRSTRFSYMSNPAKLFSVMAMGRIGEYFNGRITSISTSWMYRYQPYANLSVDVNYNDIDLPESQGYTDTRLILVGPRLDLTFSKKVFWTTIVQYNNQVNNVNLNTRLQWRFKPVSDFFVVYTDNYFATHPDQPYNLGWMNSKNRALVVKLTYWLSV